ncbi:MAG TPA: hypothetical protein VFL83_10030 [Anaeromyxobacter sp.]|nr:hypothetical protein [Anaeromyxobacter sp.]
MRRAKARTRGAGAVGLDGRRRSVPRNLAREVERAARTRAGALALEAADGLARLDRRGEFAPVLAPRRRPPAPERLGEGRAAGR